MRHPVLTSLCLAVATGGLMAACVPPDPVTRGSSDFQTYCAACHGADATGARGPDLTTLTARSGGSFPIISVLDRVEGYSEGLGRDAGTMPHLGFLMEGRLVRIDVGDGLTKPVPEALAATVRYLRTIQR